jgi:hypothetical protein
MKTVTPAEFDTFIVNHPELKMITQLGSTLLSESFRDNENHIKAMRIRKRPDIPDSVMVIPTWNIDDT